MIIGIGGASRSGKSTLAKFLLQALPDALHIAQDDYAKPINELPLVGDNPDWEHPDGILFDKMYNKIVQENADHEFIIAEGFLVFANPKLKSLFDFSIFVTIDHDTFFQRKKEDIRWGQITDEYIEHIWQSFLKFGKVDSTEVDLCINGNELRERQMNKVLRQITSG